MASNNKDLMRDALGFVRSASTTILQSEERALFHPLPQRSPQTYVKSRNVPTCVEMAPRNTLKNPTETRKERRVCALLRNASICLEAARARSLGAKRPAFVDDNCQ